LQTREKADKKKKEGQPEEDAAWKKLGGKKGRFTLGKGAKKGVRQRGRGRSRQDTKDNHRKARRKA